jgi:hypothetical protein
VADDRKHKAADEIEACWAEMLYTEENRVAGWSARDQRAAMDDLWGDRYSKSFTEELSINDVDVWIEN